jgi:hypothetical protein
MNTPLPALPRRKLPTGIQSLAKLRQGDHYYVDKTGLAIDLIESGSYFFLSRPRRFGKSLLVDTFKELFEGNRALFGGLAAETRWDWTKCHPVIRISFSDGHLRSRDELDGHIRNLLSAHREEQGLPAFAGPDTTDIPGDFADLIRRTHLQAGAPVVVLIDEYDKPILDNITDRSTAQALRDGLRNLYSVLKGADPYLKFVFLTGVSKFSKVSLFSGLNNLTDITVEPAYSALCGYTDEDVDTVFAPELPGLDREEIRRWYNGYNWGGTSVYNPFDVLLLFRKRVFRSYWFETATPTFLINLLADRQYFTPDLGRLQSDHALLSSFDVDRIEPEALLFQAGYLTILGATPATPEDDPIYTLGYPNREVESSLNRALLPGYGVPERQVLHARIHLREALRRGDVAALEPLVKALFASIPHDWYRNNPLAGFEGHYASVFYSYFAALGLDIRLEDTTNHGRIDMAVLFRGRVFVFEFKVVADTATGDALQQIKAKGYAEKYLGRGEPVHLIGIEFSRAARNVVGFAVETLAQARPA